VIAVPPPELADRRQRHRQAHGESRQRFALQMTLNDGLTDGQGAGSWHDGPPREQLVVGFKETTEMITHR
jgi:hypothetical protein